MKTFLAFIGSMWVILSAVVSIIFLAVGIFIALFNPWVWILWLVDLFFICPVAIYGTVKLTDL